MDFAEQLDNDLCSECPGGCGEASLFCKCAAWDQIDAERERDKREGKRR